MATEKRLIEVKYAWKKAQRIYSDPVLLHVINNVLDETPTVDAVEVVRCKDCKHGIWDEEEQMWECIVGVDLNGDADTYAMFHEYNDGEHFCSYGERRAAQMDGGKDNEID